MNDSRLNSSTGNENFGSYTTGSEMGFGESLLDDDQVSYSGRRYIVYTLCVSDDLIIEDMNGLNI